MALSLESADDINTSLQKVKKNITNIFSITFFEYILIKAY